MRRWPARVLAACVRAYQLLLSSWMPASCRFTPSCSNYALLALERHGAGAGSALALARIARCAPWCAGGHDPVPVAPPRLFSRLLPPSLRNASEDVSPHP